MKKLTVAVTSEQHERLQALSDRMGHSVGECLKIAVAEFIEHWETHLDDVAHIEEGEKRAVLGSPKD